MTSQNLEDVFDVIIIGAGTAGSLLAARLPSSSSLRLLVLEAGENRNDDVNVRTPGFSRRLLGNPSYDWRFETAPEEGLNGRVIQQPRGKLWGGSSAINSHALVYPSQEYHNAWDTLMGGSWKRRWNWDGIGKYYKQFQTVQQPSDEAQLQLQIPKRALEGVSRADSEEAQQNDKRVLASYPLSPHPLDKAWVDAIHDLGYSSSRNPADGEVIGGSVTPNAIDASRGERSHAGVVFLEPSLKEQNLVIRSNVIVGRILFAEEKRNGNLVATGVVYKEEDGGGDIVVHSHQELIVCAGTFGSPKILELSGIGRREYLEKLGIKCLYDLPGVGENLQDHLNFGPSVEVHDTIETWDVGARDPTVAEAAKKLYETEQKGPYAGGGAYVFSYLPLELLSSDTGQRNLANHVENVLRETSSTTSDGLKAQYDIIQNMIADPEQATATVFMVRKQRYTSPSKPAPGNYMTVIAMLSYPFSRGGTHIRSADPFVPPEIKFNYLQHPLDLEILSRHMIQIGRVLKLSQLSQHLKPSGNTLPSGYPRHVEEIEDIERYIRQFAATNYHPVGTCAMMDENLDGVVDESLKVYGTTNLRVCDASVIPIIPRGNILSTVYALAGKGADILMEDLKIKH